MRVKDQLHRTLQLDTTPRRIISLVPSQTELLVDLGLKEYLVGITKFCVHPKELRKEVTIVGGTKSVHVDRVMSLQPDLIICNKEENTLEMVKELESIAPVWVSDISTLEESLEMIQKLGELLDVEAGALEIIRRISAERDAFQEFMKNRPFRNAVYLIWKKPYMTAGNNTFINSLLRLNKFENIITESRYPEVSIAAMKRADLILLSSEPYPFKEMDVRLLKELTGKEVLFVDGEYFSWYGSRLRKAFTYFRSLHRY